MIGRQLNENTVITQRTVITIRLVATYICSGL